MIHTFSNGATVEDNRELGLSLWLKGVNYNFFEVYLSTTEKITIRATRSDFELNELRALKSELEAVAAFVAELEDFLSIDNPKTNCNDTND